MNIRRLLAMSLLLAMPMLLQAAGRPAASQEQFDPLLFPQQKEAILTELARGERYRDITPRNRREVIDALDRMEGILQGVTSLDELSEQRRVWLFNAQEIVNTTLTAAEDDSRLVCKRETEVGSHRVKNVCRTVRDRRIAQERGQEWKRNYFKSLMPDSN